jgi:hypothetical protein
MIFMVVVSNCVFNHSLPALSLKLGFLAFSGSTWSAAAPLSCCFSELPFGLGACIGWVCDDGEESDIVGIGTAQSNGSASLWYQVDGRMLLSPGCKQD